MTRPLPFKHIFMQLRHPLSVVASWHSERWNFISQTTWETCGYENWTMQELDMKGFFDAGDVSYLSGELQALEWWSQAVSRIFSTVECWWKVEDFSSEMAEAICEKAGFSGCSVHDWGKLIEMHVNANSHRAKNESAPKPSWETLCGRDATKHQLSEKERVCDRARALCREFNYDNC
jgi:hypothetical protein